MGRRLEIPAELLEIMLNFLVVMCAVTALDAVAESRMPAWTLAVLAIAPVGFYAARRWCGSLILFLIIHGAVVYGLVLLAGWMTGNLLRQAEFGALGFCYAVYSVKMRVSQKENSEGQMPLALAAGVAFAAFALCSLKDYPEGCSRILWISLLWAPGMWLRNYLENYSRYMELNRNVAGTLPEERIFRSGAGMVALYSGVSLLVLSVGSRTALIPRLSELVRKCIFAVIRLILYVLEWLAGDEQPAVQQESAGDGGMDQMLEALGSETPPIWMQVLEKILVAATLAAVLAALLFLLFLLVRFIIRGFYGREKIEQRIETPEYVEEEERLKGKGEQGRERLPFLGGTADQRVRRIFRRTVLEEAKSCEWNEISSMTARQLAQLDVGASPKLWEELVLLYERARYTKEEITTEDVRRAGKLSRQILHTIK